MESSIATQRAGSTTSFRRLEAATSAVSASTSSEETVTSKSLRDPGGLEHGVDDPPIRGGRQPESVRRRQPAHRRLRRPRAEASAYRASIRRATSASISAEPRRARSRRACSATTRARSCPSCRLRPLVPAPAALARAPRAPRPRVLGVDEHAVEVEDHRLDVIRSRYSARTRTSGGTSSPSSTRWTSQMKRCACRRTPP